MECSNFIQNLKLQPFSKTVWNMALEISATLKLSMKFEQPLTFLSFWYVLIGFNLLTACSSSTVSFAQSQISRIPQTAANEAITHEGLSFEQLDTKVRNLFHEGKYQQVIDTLKPYLANQQSPIYPGALYNLGNAYFKINELAWARAYFEKAHLVSPIDADIRHNLQITRAQLEGDSSWSDRILGIFESLHPDELSSLASFFLLLFLATFFRRYLITRSFKLSISRSSTLLLSLTTLVLSSVVLLKSFLPPQAIVLKTTQSYSGPAFSYSELGTIQAGSKCNLIEIPSDQAWAKVEFSSSQIGWIPLKELFLLSPEHIEPLESSESESASP